MKVVLTLEKSPKVFRRVRGFGFVQMDIGMSENGRVDYRMVRVSRLSLMDQGMLENLEMVCQLEKEL